jgi:hypothetical protein
LLPTLAVDAVAALLSPPLAAAKPYASTAARNIAKHLAFHHIRSTMISARWPAPVCATTAGAGRQGINFLE